MLVTNTNGATSWDRDPGSLRISAMPQMSSSKAWNWGLVFLIIFFQIHLGMFFSADLDLDDEGVCFSTSFPLSLLLGFISYCEGSPFVASVSVFPATCTSVFWEGGWEYYTSCPSFDTSLVTICLVPPLMMDPSKLWGGGVTEPLSTTIICGGDGGVRSGPYEFGIIYV